MVPQGRPCDGCEPFHRVPSLPTLKRSPISDTLRLEGMEDQETSTTATEEGQLPNTPGSGARGVFWVHPEPRFIPFTGEATIGRTGVGGEWLIPSVEVSRSHAKLTRVGPNWVLTDLTSKNGTWVNARRVNAATLSEQDIVRLGDWVGVVTRLPPNTPATFTELAPSWHAGPVTVRAMASLARLSGSDAPLIVVGETGTGKEVVARSFHRLSGRSGRFVALNCATVPESMAEAQLFGHRRGAFTGAVNDAEGLFAAADGGTLFLDEVGDLAPPIQAKLLRVLEDASFTPVGASKPQTCDIRIVTAGQERLETLVARGTFRGDLFARLDGAQFHLTPLRTRKEEILHLLRRFLEARESDVPPTARFVERLLCYDYPYNVRELVQLARLLANHGAPRLEEHHLPRRFETEGDGSSPPVGARVSSLAEVEGSPHTPTPPPLKGRRAAWLLRHARELAGLQTVLEGNGWNVSDAARELGIPRHRALRLLAAQRAFQS